MRCRYYYRSVLQVTQESVSSTVCMSRKYAWIASFPGSPLAPTKNKNGGGELGTDSHVISRHDDVTAIITKVVTQLCSHVIGWLEQLGTSELWLRRWDLGTAQTAATAEKYPVRRKNFAYLLLPCSALKKNCYEAMKKDFSWLALHSGVQNKLTTTF